MTSGAAAAGLGDWLRVVLPRLPAELADPAARVRLADLGRALPGSCPAVLEVRLTPPSQQVDLSLCLRDPGAARQVAAAVPTAAARLLLERWAAGAFPAVRSLWVEWDLEGTADAIPTVIAKLDGPAEPGWVVDELLPVLQGGPLTPGQRTAAGRCLAALPRPGRLLYVFALHGRPGRPLRLEICGLAPAALVSYLEPLAADHASRQAALAPLFEAVTDLDRLHLSFDLLQDGEIGPRFGVEGSFARLPGREPGWAVLFDRLAAAGLCAAGRRDAVLAWPGWDSFLTAPEDWPVAGLADGGGGLAGFCARGLSHVKVVSYPDRPPEAKAYLAFNALRTPPAAPRDRPVGSQAPDRAGARPPAG